MNTDHRAAQRALLAGNFAIACGVMVVPGSLNDLVRSLDVSVAVGGQLITLAAAVMALGAPLFAAAAGGWDRRRLLTLALVAHAVGHALCALAPSYAALVPLRVLSVLGAAVFTPQAAAAIGAMTAPQARGRAITFVFLGWSLASVFGMPLHSYIGEAFGFRWAFALVALLGAAAALGVWRTMPDGVRPPPMDLRAWREVFSRPALLAIVGVTALVGSGQFTLLSYFAPYWREVFGASAAQVSLLFLWFGAFGLAGNVLLSRCIDRVGAARAVALMLGGIALTLLLWPLAGSVAAVAAVLVPWGLGSFGSNSAQQARLGAAAPALAPALMALNTTAIYVGQSIGAAGGGALLAAHGYEALSWVALVWVLAALALSAWAAAAMRAKVAAHA